MSAIVTTILDPSYREFHEIIMISLFRTLYSCIRVNRAFCRIFIPILWRNPFKFVKDDDKLIKIFNTLTQCLDASNNSYLVLNESIKIKDLPTSKAYFQYHNFIKEFELNPLQRRMRLWTSNNENRYDSLNIYYNDLLSGPRLFHKNSTNLIPSITDNFLKLQNSLSPNIQHLEISINTDRTHIDLLKNLINFI
ncbi:hypothetical protein C1645_835331 [Glomus cerebriforme]|uniref:Uncharacterized protein n=1 Tax=Glomus cerebriforme TaxID=658196 RepID=A0A397S7Y0_9GLOM|nr:hypothetical protein C1645_835331 [Glomus cerebriforme]